MSKGRIGWISFFIIIILVILLIDIEKLKDKTPLAERDSKKLVMKCSYVMNNTSSVDQLNCVRK
ncbi:hypothetical protein EXT65_21055 [Pectobacterium carotovorum subsp. carotovorum]|nr:hypothetical protein [Pectobacterium carotovorum]MCL6336285.1 hypothetical protein [Pectobacterium carotovorum subsp. carotovorum]